MTKQTLAVEKFVEVFVRIDLEELKEQLNQFLENNPKDINMEKLERKVMFGRTNFFYNYRY